MKNIETLNELLQNEISDLYSAESQITKALSSLIKNSSTVELSRDLTQHLAESEEHRGRLEEMARLIGGKTSGKSCLAMEGIVEEYDEILRDLRNADPSVRDSVIVATARKIEHYEIVSYESVISYAETLGRSDIAEIAMQTLSEERDADRRLVELCEDKILPQCNVEGNQGENIIEGEDDEYSPRPPHHRSAH